MKPNVAAFPAAILFAAAAAAQAPLAQHIAAEIMPNDLKADVSFLASDALEGRGTPSRGLDIAAEFVAAQFRRAGLEPAGDDGYFQTAPFVNVTPNPDGAQLTLEIGGKTIVADKAAMAIQDAAPLDLARGGAYLVSVVDPSALDQLTAEQVRGKTLIIDSATAPGSGGRGAGFPSTRRIGALAEKLRPAMVIVLRANGMGASANARLREASADPAPVVVLWDKAFRDALADVKAGPVDATVAAHLGAPKIEPVNLRNVVGVLRGTDASLRDTYVLLTAHYDHLGVRGTGEGDHIYNGANDDASGTASVIEIARALATANLRPKRSIVFIALFGEEMGLLGSRYYAGRPIYPLAKTVADLNLEQMGRPDDNSGPRLGILNATGFDYTDMTTVLAKAGEDFGIKLMKDEQNSDPFFARSDNQAFADAGVPSHTLSVGYVFKEYHQPGDEWPKIDYENMAKVDRTVALGVFRIANNPEPPKWNAENPKTAPYLKAR
jgi:hypothetical protein